MAVRIEKTRAKLGARLLDLFVPGWHKRIKVKDLRLASCTSCVLGQLFGEYGKGAETVFAMRSGTSATNLNAYVTGQSEASEEAGFVINHQSPENNYGNLTEAWKREIAARVRKDKPAVVMVDAGLGVYCDVCRNTTCPTPLDKVNKRKQVPA